MQSEQPEPITTDIPFNSNIDYTLDQTTSSYTVINRHDYMDRLHGIRLADQVLMVIFTPAKIGGNRTNLLFGVKANQVIYPLVLILFLEVKMRFGGLMMTLTSNIFINIPYLKTKQACSLLSK